MIFTPLVERRLNGVEAPGADHTRRGAAFPTTLPETVRRVQSTRRPV